MQAWPQCAPSAAVLLQPLSHPLALTTASLRTTVQDQEVSGRLAAAVSELQAVDAEEGATSEQLAGVEGRLGALLGKRQAALYDVELQLALEAGQVEALVGGWAVGVGY